MQDDPLIQRRTLTPELRAQLDQVNTQVNNATTYVPDIVKYGVLERWEDASKEGDAGDCEDFALAKRTALRALGWPQASLDIAECLDETGQEHAILIARTDQGDFALDNRQTMVCRWDELAAFGYRFQQMTVGGTLMQWRTITG